MNKENIVDSIYLALELTKIRYNDNNSRTDSNIIDTFNFYVTELTNIEDMCKINKIIDENKTLHTINNDLKERFKDVVPKSVLNDIICKIRENSMDMEPSVSILLIDYINNIINKY